MSLRDHILQVASMPALHKITVPEWGCDVFVREMTARDRDAFEVFVTKNNGINFRAALIVRTVCDESGTLIFGEQDIKAVGEMKASTISPIANLAIRVNAIGKKDIEELEGNSPATPSDE
jgi:hypothetical protein